LRFLLHASPEALDEHIVASASAAVRRHSATIKDRVGEHRTGELTALVRINDL